MAPAAQKKGKKPSAATKKDSPAPKKQPQPQEQQEGVVMKEAEEQKPNDSAAPQEASETTASADDAFKDVVSEAAVKDEDAPAVEPDTSGDNAEVVEEVKATQEEVAIENMEGTDTGDVDEEVEEVEEEEEDEEDAEEDVGKASREDITMQNGDDGGDVNLEEAGTDDEGNAAGDGVPKSMPDDSSSPSSGKIFIGGLSRETTTEVLTRHFEKYGELTDSVIMKNRGTGQPRGFGFVTYADPSIVDRVLQDTHVIDGRTVDAKRTVPRERMSVPTKGPKTKKIFVGGLTSSTKEDDLKAYFGKFGKITGCQIMQDHKIGKSRGFGFVTFESEQVVDEILAQGKMHEVDGKQVEIKKAEPKRADPPPVHDRSAYVGGRRSGPVAGAGAGAGAYGASAGFYGGFHASDAPMYGAGGYFNRGAGRPGGMAYGDTYGYGGGYGAPYGYGEFDEGYGSMNYNNAGYGSGSGYGYSYGGGGGYGTSSRGYGSGRYHPYSR